MTSTAPRATIWATACAGDQSTVIIGGMHASALPEEALEHADQVVVGEGETTSLTWQKGRIKDKIVYAPCLMNLDEALCRLFLAEKRPARPPMSCPPAVCPFCCSFCSTSRMFKALRQRSVESVINELRYYKEIGFRYMNFEDDNFTADKERAKESAAA